MRVAVYAATAIVGAVVLVRHILGVWREDRARRRRLAAGFDACQRAWAVPDYTAAERKAAVDRLLDGSGR